MNPRYPIKITNTLTGNKESFVPMTAGKVKMYVCGPTVYGLTHVGNARPAVFFDVVRRYLKHVGFEVTYVSNYTDVDDKIIHKAREEKTTSSAISEKYIVEFRRDMDSLAVEKPEVAPKVTDHIEPIIRFIGTLVQRGVAYAVKDGEVFFSVRSFPHYGKLSGKKVDELLTGVRIKPGELKKDPLDFSLWKPQKNEDEPAWDSPWGKGRPGWHIECSVMSIQYLGETFDIHGGGIDLVHPHHENEIAQSEACTGKTFAKYWIHNNLVNINSEKMSKSVGNIFCTRDFVSKFTAETLKYLLLSGHYRAPIDFSERHIKESQAALSRIYRTIQRSEQFLADGKFDKVERPTSQEQALLQSVAGFKPLWEETMSDDFNTAKVLGFLFDLVRKMNAVLDQKSAASSARSREGVQGFLVHLHELSLVMNLFREPVGSYLEKLKDSVLQQLNITRDSIQGAIDERKKARANKDYQRADELRLEWLKKGIEFRDTGTTTEWDIVFSV